MAFYAPQRKLGYFGRKLSSRLAGAADGTVSRRVLDSTRKAMSYRGRGLARGSDFNNMTGSGIQRQRRKVNRFTRMDINDANSRTPRSIKSNSI